MSLVLARRARQLELRKACIEQKFRYEEEQSEQQARNTLKKYIYDSRCYYASARIQSIVRGFLDRLLVKELLREIRAVYLINRIMRGKLGRLKWMREYWKQRSVVKSDNALKDILRRSTLIREVSKLGKGNKGYHWKEMYDPLTDAFWYYNQKNKFSTWDCPLVLQRELICSWEGFETFGGLPSSGRCRMVFDKVTNYQNHLRTAHTWYCSACETRCKGVCFPTCTLCGNALSGDGVDGARALKESVDRIRAQMADFLAKDGLTAASGGSGKGDYVIKKRLVELSKEKRRQHMIENDDFFDVIDMKAILLTSDAGEGSLPQLTFPNTTDELYNAVEHRREMKKVEFLASTKNASTAPLETMFKKKRREVKMQPALTSVRSHANAKDFNSTSAQEREDFIFADPLDLGQIPHELFEEVVHEIVEFGELKETPKKTKKMENNNKSPKKKSPSGGSPESSLGGSVVSPQQGHEHGSLELDDNRSIGSIDSAGNESLLSGDGSSLAETSFAFTAASSASTFSGDLGDRKLLVCLPFLKGKCSLSTCPQAHPGLRDSAQFRFARLPGRHKKVPYVDLCEFVRGVENRCPEAGGCTLYHQYIRPSTRDIILKMYPTEVGEKCAVLPFGATLQGQVSRGGKFNGYGTLTWRSGAVFMGDFVDGVREGLGIYRTRQGDEYVGGWKGGKKSGWGVLTTGNGETYVGEFHEGKLHGAGWLRNAAGDEYLGMFSNHKYHGPGMLTKMNGDKYMGYLENGYAQGLGILFLGTKKERYKGYFDRNFRHGKGAYTYKNGSKYFGSWYRGVPEGFGIWLSPKGERAIGEWSAGRKHGNVRYYFQNGDFYDGNFVKDVACGMGLYFHANGNVYYGEWEDDMRNGRGTYNYANGSKYTGNWVENNIDGKGKFDYANGYFYRGQFSLNKKNGRGIFTWTNGNVFTGDFVSDRITGYGEMVYAAGHRYVGEWLDGKKHGKGRFFYAQGHNYEGDFVAERRHGKGVMTYLPGTVIEESYNGDWADDMKHGYGVYKYRADEGTVYEGEWALDGREGKGKISYLDGSYYRGDIHKEMMWGKGVYVGSDGTQYDGV